MKLRNLMPRVVMGVAPFVMAAAIGGAVSACSSSPAPPTPHQQVLTWWDAQGQKQTAAVLADGQGIINDLKTSDLIGASILADQSAALAGTYQRHLPPVDPSDYSAYLNYMQAADKYVASGDYTDAAPLLSMATSALNNWEKYIDQHAGFAVSTGS